MRTIILTAFLALAAPAPALAQSFLGFRALGYPVLPAGGRTVGTGNLGIGLAGTELSASDPAAAAWLPVPTISLTMQPTWGDFEVGDESGTSNTTRFPLIALGFPVPEARGVVTASLAGFMEQRWAGERSDMINLGGRQVRVEDTCETNGGASVARLGWAQRIGGRMSVGVNAGVYVGRLDQFFDRKLDTLTVTVDVRSFSENYRWRYGGYNLAAGVSVDPHRLVHLAGTVEWSSDITAHPRPGTEGEHSYSIPLRLSAGATGMLTSRLSMNASIAYQDWSSAAGYAADAVSSLAYSYGGGVEWTAIQGEARSLPVRAGYRRVVPPFRYGRYDPVETVWSLGAGLNFVEFNGNRLGWMDLAIERGSRTSHPLTERFWRATISLGISRS